MNDFQSKLVSAIIQTQSSRARIKNFTRALRMSINATTTLKNRSLFNAEDFILEELTPIVRQEIKNNLLTNEFTIRLFDSTLSALNYQDIAKQVLKEMKC